MCLGIPGKVTETYTQNELPMGKVEFGVFLAFAGLAFPGAAWFGAGSGLASSARLQDEHTAQVARAAARKTSRSIFMCPLLANPLSPRENVS